MNDDNQTERDLSTQDDLIEGEVVAPIDTAKLVAQEFEQGKNHKYVRFTMAALSSIPWVGSFLGATASLSGEIDQDKINQLLKLWLQEHESKIKQLGITLQDIYSRLDGFGEEVQERINSQEYLSLVRRAFRSWAQSETEEKRQMIKRLITNAGATKLCPDDLIRLFIKWIDDYHESHFAVIKEVYKDPRITRGQIWDHIHTERPLENSAEADLFRYLIRDLSTGGVIRQDRETTSDGQFLTRGRTTNKSYGGLPRVMESAFEDTKPYVLTELGSQFISYVLNDVVLRLDT